MASMTLPWLPLIILISVPFQVSTDSTPSIHTTSVEVGFLWEHPRQENHHSTEAVVNTQNLKGVLRLLCFISPSLPGKYESKKNELVKWEKTTGHHEQEPVGGIRLWDDDLTTVAMSLDNVTYDIIGTYTCSYGQLSKSISVKVANIDIIKKLKMPSNFKEVINYATHIHDSAGINGWDRHSPLLKSKGRSVTCEKSNKISKTYPTTIHKVRPHNIRVIAALGDGFTSGFGARALSWNGFFTDYKDTSWSIGGEGRLNTTTTLPNILKEFSSKLNGFSTKIGIFDFNKAQTQSSSGELEVQVKELITAMKNDKEIDFSNDWKLLTIWTGMVDLCYICQDPNKYSSGNYIKNIMHSLNILKKEVPRLFINLVPSMDVTILNKLFHKTPTCQILEQNACPCAATSDYKSRKLVSEAASKNKHLLEKLVNSGIYDVTDQFTVVLQPFMINGPKNKSGSLAEELFAPDCLHFNAKGHAAAAVALWNSMLKPLPSKMVEWNIDQQINCPSQGYEYLATRVNSNVVMSNDDDDDDDSGTMPPAAAITLSIILSITVLGVTIFVWRSRKSRPRNDTMRLLHYPHKPRL